MKKAPCLQIAQFTLPHEENRAGVTEELARYRRLRFIASRTAARAQQERLYHARVKEWLRRPENRWCRVYLQLLGRQVPATQCHHYQGRRGMLLLHEPFWIPVSWEGHRWINEHRHHARELGLLCPLGRYNSPVRDASNQGGSNEIGLAAG